MASARRKGKAQVYSCPYVTTTSEFTRLRLRLLKVIEDAVTDKQVEFKSDRDYPYTSELTLFSRLGTNAEIDRIPYDLVKFYANDSTAYWLNYTLELESQPGIQFVRKVSAFIFRGQLVGDSKTPVVRAEWDDAREQVHAQPHWHIYQAPFESQPELGGRQFLGDESAREFGIEPAAELRVAGRKPDWRIHYAMASLWHTGNDTPKVPLDQRGIVQWTRGCLRYLKQQIKFVEGAR